MPDTAEFIKKHASSPVNRAQKGSQSGEIKEQAKTKTMASHQSIKSVVIAGGRNKYHFNRV